MMKLSYILATFLAAFVWICPVSAQMSKLNPISTPDAKTFAETFRKGPGRDFSAGPLGVWNDRLKVAGKLELTPTFRVFAAPPNRPGEVENIYIERLILIRGNSYLNSLTPKESHIFSSP